MAITYTADTPRALIEVILPTHGMIRPNMVTIKLTKKQQGKPDYPKTYTAEEVMEVEIDREDLQTMINHLDRIL